MERSQARLNKMNIHYYVRQSAQVMPRAHCDHLISRTRSIPARARAEQDLELNICNELLDVATHYIHPTRMEA